MEGKYSNEGWFGKHLAIYELASGFLEPIGRRAARMLGQAPLRVLNIATGMGALAFSLARAGHDVTGVDLDREMLVRAARKLSAGLALGFRHCDATKLPFEGQSFDAATVSFAMHDVPHAIALRILREAKRILRPQGCLLIVDYHDLDGQRAARLLRRIALLYESPNYRDFVRRSTARTLETAGFRVLARETLLGAVQLTTAR